MSPLNSGRTHDIADDQGQLRGKVTLQGEREEIWNALLCPGSIYVYLNIHSYSTFLHYILFCSHTIYWFFTVGVATICLCNTARSISLELDNDRPARKTKLKIGLYVPGHSLQSECPVRWVP
jgi:hypothetical protein